MLDGYAMAQRGQAGPALAVAALGSLFAGSVVTLLIAIGGPPIAYYPPPPVVYYPPPVAYYPRPYYYAPPPTIVFRAGGYHGGAGYRSYGYRGHGYPGKGGYGGGRRWH